MTGVGGLLAVVREAGAWFASLAVPSKLTVVTIAVATAGVGVAVVAPDALPISPFASSHHVAIPSATGQVRSAVPVNPPVVASAKPTAASTPTTKPTAPSTSAAPTVPGVGESSDGKGRTSASPSSSASTKSTAKPTTSKPTASASVYYKDCEAAWKAGAAPIKAGHPGYRLELDPDHNGVACEKR